MCVVADKPDLSCEAQWSGRLGQTDYEILCTGRMNPEPLQVVWRWSSATDGDIEIHNEVINNDDLAEVILWSLTSVLVNNYFRSC